MSRLVFTGHKSMCFPIRIRILYMLPDVKVEKDIELSQRPGSIMSQ